MRTSKIFVASVFMLAVLTLLPSCMTTRTSVGSYRETEGDEYVYAKGKQCYLFWGLVPLGRTRVATPADDKQQQRQTVLPPDAED
ncbi:MAG: hypothetical protein MSH41_07310 [Bacteroidales bacterium]|nr:hypothetical protein [Bacteroidales bacterium]